MNKKNWQPISDRIIKKGDMYSVKGFDPSLDDVADILDIDENAKIYQSGNVFIFKNGDLDRVVEG